MTQHAQTDTLSRRSALKGFVTIAGAAVTLPAIGSLAACSSTPASLEGLMPLVRGIADRIIPQTDTPGAIAANVPDYVAAVFDAHFTADQQSDFASGLTAVSAFVKDEGVTSFESYSADQMDAVLAKLASGEGGGGSAIAAWKQLRDMVIFGFYTSEEATQELSYEEIPGRYEACLPLSEVGNAWLDRGV